MTLVRYGLIAIAMVGIFGACPQVTALGQDLAVQDRPMDRLIAARGKIYDCAANVVYCMGRLFGIHLAYDEVVELVPPQSGGNSMLELKAALTAVGCATEAFWLDVNELMELSIPAVILDLSRPVVMPGGKRVGHFFLVLPLDRWYIALVNWPARVSIISRQWWGRSIQARGISRVAALLLEG